MRFSSIHPTDVPDQHAATIFLVLASQWTEVDKDELAGAFVRGSVYRGSLPESFRARVHFDEKTYGVLLESLAGDAFKVRVLENHSPTLEVAAATAPRALVAVWGRPNRPGAEPHVDLEEAARQYKTRHGEDHSDTLKRHAARQRHEGS